MADKCDLCLLGLIFLSSLLTGSSEVNDAHVFISSGENVRLSCNNTLRYCKSTTWLYNNRFRHSVIVELIGLGIKNKDTERHERLSLGSDCSLNINNITEEDYGFYTCQQWTGVIGQQKQHGTDASVYLHVLHVSSSSSQTEISAGRSVTLFCQLYSYYAGDSCDDWIHSEGIELFWVNQSGVKLKISDSRYQISAPGHCIITLTTTLVNEDHNRAWRCNVTHRDQVKSSVTYTVKSSAQDKTTTSVIPVHTTKSTTPRLITSTRAPDSTTLIPVSSSNSETTSRRTTAAAPTEGIFSLPVIVVVIVVSASIVLLIPALIIWLICKKRAGVRRATDDSVEQTDDVTYTEVTVHSKNRAKKNKVRCDDKVTYASIRGSKAGDQENCSQLYASVNKNHHKSDK